MDFESPETALVIELRALAKLTDPKNEFFVVHDGVRVRVTYSSGSSSSITLSIPYDEVAGQFLTSTANANENLYRDAPATAKLVATRPMQIRVSPENANHEAGKRQGLDVEHQTGDEKFDALVYIDAPSAEPLPRIFSSEILRAAILELIYKLEFRSVGIDNIHGEIVTSSSDFPNLSEKTKTRGADAVAALVRLAKTLPQVMHSGDSHPVDPLDRPTTWMGLLGIVLFFAGAPIYFLGAGDRCPTGEDAGGGAWECCWPGVLGFILAAPCAVLTGKLAHVFAKKTIPKTSSTSTGVITFSMSSAILVLMVVWISSSLVISHASWEPPVVDTPTQRVPPRREIP